MYDKRKPSTYIQIQWNNIYIEVVKKNIPESERVAGNARCCVGESIVADRSPRVVVENFKTTFI